MADRIDTSSFDSCGWWPCVLERYYNWIEQFNWKIKRWLKKVVWIWSEWWKKLWELESWDTFIVIWEKWDWYLVKTWDWIDWLVHKSYIERNTDFSTSSLIELFHFYDKVDSWWKKVTVLDSEGIEIWKLEDWTELKVIWKRWDRVYVEYWDSQRWYIHMSHLTTMKDVFEEVKKELKPRVEGNLSDLRWCVVWEIWDRGVEELWGDIIYWEIIEECIYGKRDETWIDWLHKVSSSDLLDELEADIWFIRELISLYWDMPEVLKTRLKADLDLISDHGEEFAEFRDRFEKGMSAFVSRKDDEYTVKLKEMISSNMSAYNLHWIFMRHPGVYQYIKYFL